MFGVLGSPLSPLWDETDGGGTVTGRPRGTLHRRVDVSIQERWVQTQHVSTEVTDIHDVSVPESRSVGGRHDGVGYRDFC